MAILKRERSSGTRYEVRVFNKAAAKHVYVGTFIRRRDAVDAEAEAKRRFRLGERPVRQELLFADLAKRWLGSQTAVRPSTQDDYRKALNRVKPYLDRKLCLSIEKLTTSITEKLTTPSFSSCAVS